MDPGGFPRNRRLVLLQWLRPLPMGQSRRIAVIIDTEGRQLPDFRSFLLPRKDYQIDDNWHVAGLAGSGSKDIVVDGAFVPGYRSQSHWDYVFARRSPAGIIIPGHSTLAVRSGFLRALTASVVGAARGFLDAWLELSRTRFSFGSEISQDPFAQKLAAENLVYA